MFGQSPVFVVVTPMLYCFAKRRQTGGYVISFSWVIMAKAYDKTRELLQASRSLMSDALSADDIMIISGWRFSSSH